MIVWLASYPRSGNTLLRMVLKHCFEVASYSLYSDQEFSVPAIREIVGERAIGSDPQKFLNRLRAQGSIACVKTHAPSKREHRHFQVNIILPAIPKVLPDLRKVGANPDYWYPLAWSSEIRAGKVVGRRFAGEPIALYRTA